MLHDVAVRRDLSANNADGAAKLKSSKRSVGQHPELYPRVVKRANDTTILCIDLQKKKL